MPAFDRYIGIDYSGANTPVKSLTGLRVYMAQGKALPVEVPPPPSRRKYWTRQGIAQWLVAQLTDGRPTLVGIDHGFSFPLPYFQAHGLKHDWASFLDDFQRHWPADTSTVWIRDILNGRSGNAVARRGNSNWVRVTERRTRSAKSVFNFNQKQGCVAFSTHAGIPWLRFIRQQPGTRVHFWPFDGWRIPAGRSAIVEVYPSLWRAGFPLVGKTLDQQDAYCVAAWLSQSDRTNSLTGYLTPNLKATERKTAEIEGWILGVM